ncbi:biotin--[acetyl-CoA-carboxylase] ligase [Bacteroides sp. 51]|uniref:biotin--[acetyl-CoA-carboxylase] ligase n=1 Tax=Bacteroides sp. 51 TaxID=2302938 RepID=UPI0013D64EE6|nr:biotin--[acetyl-CoA-carboxylase] ligase [Bacteroides sp. 51]NDV83047.1 biotin--[acetyl-CoA-carboxylase] ligase [Bacteroides sp. 51]
MTSFKAALPVIYLPETDSTSNYLTALSTKEKLEEFTVIKADYQTAGKGQRGNSWESAKGQNLLFSIILYPNFLEIRKQFLLSQAIALAIKEELDTFSDGFSIKWPNDIYWKEQKICGILIENDLLGSSIQKSIAGIGININQQQFHSQAPNPVSLWQITGKEHDSTAILNGIIHRIMDNYALLKEGEAQEVSECYHQSLFRKEGTHAYSDHSGEFMASIVCVKPQGTLILRDLDGKEREYAFKEVQYSLTPSDKK